MRASPRLNGKGFGARAREEAKQAAVAIIEVVKRLTNDKYRNRDFDNKATILDKSRIQISFPLAECSFFRSLLC